MLGPSVILIVSARPCYAGNVLASRDEDVQKALSMASRDEPPFGSLALCNDGFGESRALRILDDYLSLSDADFGRYDTSKYLASGGRRRFVYPPSTRVRALPVSYRENTWSGRVR